MHWNRVLSLLFHDSALKMKNIWSDIVYVGLRYKEGRESQNKS